MNKTIIHFSYLHPDTHFIYLILVRQYNSIENSNIFIILVVYAIDLYSVNFYNYNYNKLFYDATHGGLTILPHL